MPTHRRSRNASALRSPREAASNWCSSQSCSGLGIKRRPGHAKFPHLLLVETGAAEIPDVRSSIDSSGIVSIGYFNAYDFASGITARAKTGESRLALAQLRARTEGALAYTKGVTSDWHDR